LTLTLQQIAEYFEPLPPDIGLDGFEPGRIPAHVAVIMDGNGRWAQKRGLTRAAGHKAGIEGVRALIRTANDLGVRYLTIYSFSTENWSRPLTEVRALMKLFASTMSNEIDAMCDEQVRIRVIGDMDALPEATRRVYQDAIERTSGNTGMTLVIAASYGSRAEIVAAARRLATRALNGELDAEAVAALGEEEFAACLTTAGMPDPDLLIRTSGEMRLSNFLLYQIAYSELYVTDVLWPDFDKYEFLKAVIDFQSRNRRYGGI
jgi:undecaprenyl diphosphate synthase